MEYVRARNQTALILGSQQISYHELIHHSSSYAQLLEESPCEKVALLGENRLEWGYALYGAWQRGCVVIPLDAMASPEEIAYMLEDSRPEVLFSSREKLPTVQKALPELSYTPRILVFEELEKMPFQEQEHPETLSLEAPGHNTALNHRKPQGGHALLREPPGQRRGGEQRGSLFVQSPGQRSLLHAALQEGEKFVR